jgi:hypothetical protein
VGIRNFFRLLVRGVPSRRDRHHDGHDVADTTRDALGPAGGGPTGGRVTGNAVYKHLEKTVGPNQPGRGRPERD